MIEAGSKSHKDICLPFKRTTISCRIDQSFDIFLSDPNDPALDSTHATHEKPPKKCLVIVHHE